MNITIAHRMRPFSHKMGSIFLLPNSHFKVELFPTLLRFIDLENRIEPIEIRLFIRGPIHSFTAELDLEIGSICVFGRTLDGYMRYSLFYKDSELLLLCEKTSSILQLQYGSTLSQLKPKQALAIPVPLLLKESQGLRERLHLGVHKAQDWELMQRRFNLQELFPFWLALAQWVSPIAYEDNDQGMFSLIHKCQTAIEKKEKLQIINCFKNVFLAAFEGVFVPRLFDSDYQGILDVEDKVLPATALLLQSAKLLRRLFFVEEEHFFSILPCVPPELHCGRIIQLQTTKLDRIDIEWSKKRLRRMFIQTSNTRPIVCQLPKDISSCRLRVHKKDQGQKLQVTKEGILQIPSFAHLKVWLDCFEKS
ncbi:hypothetical protein [Candidatus Rhabdochlamydia porcellionis]|jgi:hypothetical protein|uniref:Uncharacterized protein n=1 Tax=Candidatus Rhabdochlamydia porcellionis TaxID=225148 RepID=A0ABX8Z030_9BACT|nr:hypothetical protein [Candidatus Rhabdochlamydia porcellionis]QZA58999.1 hypothetical protein RHAB15C_0000883 [Candidatus Rhabdochlamydia porcellionis]